MVSTFYFTFLAPLFCLCPCMNGVVMKKHSPPIPMFADNFIPFRSFFDQHFLMGILQVALIKLNILLHKMKSTINSGGRFHQPSRSDIFFFLSLTNFLTPEPYFYFLRISVTLVTDISLILNILSMHNSHS